MKVVRLSYHMKTQTQKIVLDVVVKAPFANMQCNLSLRLYFLQCTCWFGLRWINGAKIKDNNSYNLSEHKQFE